MYLVSVIHLKQLNLLKGCDYILPEVYEAHIVSLCNFYKADKLCEDICCVDVIKKACFVKVVDIGENICISDAVGLEAFGLVFVDYEYSCTYIASASSSGPGRPCSIGSCVGRSL